MILFKQTDKKFIRMATRGDRNLSTRILNIIISLVETREIIIFSILVERFLSPLVSHQINSLSSWFVQIPSKHQKRQSNPDELN